MLREQRTTCGQGREIIYTPCSAHWAIRGQAMSPGRIEVQQTGGFLQLLRQQLDHLLLRLIGWPDHTSRTTLLSKSTAQCSLKPLKVLALLLRP